MIENILSNLQAEADFFGGEPMGSLQKLYYCEGVKKAIDIVQEVAKEYGKDTNVPSNWIPTAEMLFPRYGQKVLATVRTDVATHEVIITTYERQEYWHNGIITAWQPLPAPYQKGE
jgi:hypothetical protein